MQPPSYPPGPIFPPQTAMMPQGLPLLAPPPFPTVVCFPYASLSPSMDPWHHRVHGPTNCVADVGVHATATFGLLDRPMGSLLLNREDMDQRQQMLTLQAANI